MDHSKLPYRSLQHQGNLLLIHPQRKIEKNKLIRSTKTGYLLIALIEQNGQNQMKLEYPFCFCSTEVSYSGQISHLNHWQFTERNP